ncbi:2066_t:CDS:10, partial [Cetraspora pellucida]
MLLSIIVACGMLGQIYTTKKDILNIVQEIARHSGFAALSKDSKWKVVEVINKYYHPKAKDARVFHEHRQLTQEAKHTAVQMLKARAKPSTIYEAIRDENGEPIATRRDILNLKNNASIEALIVGMEKRGYSICHEDQKDGHIKHLFFCYKNSVKMTRCFPEVVLANATYKMNVYKLPFVNFINISNLEVNRLQTFGIADAWILDKSEKSYIWVVEKLASLIFFDISPLVFVMDNDAALIGILKKVFPQSENLLCTWHVLNNFKKNLRKHFNNNSYDKIIKLIDRIIHLRNYDTLNLAITSYKVLAASSFNMNKLRRVSINLPLKLSMTKDGVRDVVCGIIVEDSKMDHCFQIIDGIETMYEEDLELFNDEKSETGSDFILENDIHIENNSVTSHDTNDKNTVIYFKKELASHAVYHMLTPIEYPATSPEEIQYSIGKPGGEYKVMCLYLGVEVKREMRTCQGSKLCKFAASKLYNGTHQNKYGEKHHRFIFVPSNVNLELLNNLYNGTYEYNQDVQNTYAHQSGNVICCGSIVKKSCKVEFYKLTLLNLKECNLIKLYFGVDTLSEVHTSLNDIDKLRNCVYKIQKEKHPFGQDLLVANEFNKFEINYYDQIYNTLLTFAQIFTNQSTALAYQQMFEALFNLIKQLTETSSSFKHIHGEGWSCIIGDLDIAQAIGLGETLASIDNTYN